MNRLGVMVKGEFERLNKYNLFVANFVVVLMWVAMAYFLGTEELRAIIPFVIVLDSTMMTILLVGATMFYEKKENTVNSIMVTPVTEHEYLMTKVIVSVLNSLFSTLFLAGALYLMNGFTFNYMPLVLSVVVVTAVHTLIGIYLSYFSKDFTSLLLNYMGYVLVFMLPSYLPLLGVLDKSVLDYLIVLPPETSNVLVGSALIDTPEWKLIFGYAYMVVLFVVLYKFVVKPKFNEYAMKEMGV